MNRAYTTTAEYHVGWDGEREAYGVERVYGPGKSKVLGYRKTKDGVGRFIRNFEDKTVSAWEIRAATIRWFTFKPGDEPRERKTTKGTLA